MLTHGLMGAPSKLQTNICFVLGLAVDVLHLIVTIGSYTPTLQVIQIGTFEGRLFVAVPGGVWHRSLSRRVLAGGMLTCATLLEVQAADPAHLEHPVEDVSLRALSSGQ